MGKWESGIVARGCERLLHHKPYIKFFKTHGSPFQQRGTPDLLGCSKGQFVAVEVKNEEGQLSSLQIFRLTEWKLAGAVCAAVRSAEEIEQVFVTRKGNW